MRNIRTSATCWISLQWPASCVPPPLAAADAQLADREASRHARHNTLSWPPPVVHMPCARFPGAAGTWPNAGTPSGLEMGATASAPPPSAGSCKTQHRQFWNLMPPRADAPRWLYTHALAVHSNIAWQLRTQSDTPGCMCWTWRRVLRYALDASETNGML